MNGSPADLGAGHRAAVEHSDGRQLRRRRGGLGGQVDVDGDRQAVVGGDLDDRRGHGRQRVEAGARLVAQAPDGAARELDRVDVGRVVRQRQRDRELGAVAAESAELDLAEREVDRPHEREVAGVEHPQLAVVAGVDEHDHVLARRRGQRDQHRAARPRVGVAPELRAGADVEREQDVDLAALVGGHEHARAVRRVHDVADADALALGRVDPAQAPGRQVDLVDDHVVVGPHLGQDPAGAVGRDLAEPGRRRVGVDQPRRAAGDRLHIHRRRLVGQPRRRICEHVGPVAREARRVATERPVRRQVGRRAAVDRDAPDVVVLVAGDVAQEQGVRAVERVAGPDRALRPGRQRPRRRGRSRRIGGVDLRGAVAPGAEQHPRAVGRPVGDQQRVPAEVVGVGVEDRRRQRLERGVAAALLVGPRRRLDRGGRGRARLRLRRRRPRRPGLRAAAGDEHEGEEASRGRGHARHRISRDARRGARGHISAQRPAD